MAKTWGGPVMRFDVSGPSELEARRIAVRRASFVGEQCHRKSLPVDISPPPHPTIPDAKAVSSIASIPRTSCP